jgi:tetratricopeptide (TPR) repeat protein
VAERVLRLFVSSPSDVAAERARVRPITDRLNNELGGRARIDVLRWEDAFYTAIQPFQHAIDAAVDGMSGTDIVLCIVWKRAGLKLNPEMWRREDGSAYEGGTVFEFETAISVSRKNAGVPDVYLFRKTAPVSYDADRVAEQLEQHQLLQTVWKRWTQTTEGYNTAGFQHFDDPDDFEKKLESCLRQWLERQALVITGPVWDRATKGSPFRGLEPFDASHAQVFFGREAAVSRAIAKLRQLPFLLVMGASGSGKSSLLRAGVIPRVTAPGVVPDVDEWRIAVVLPSADPLSNLAEALFAASALGAELAAGDFRSARLLADLFAAGRETAIAPVSSALARAAESRKIAMKYEAHRPIRLLLAIDQMEQLFIDADPRQLEAFAAIIRLLVEYGFASVCATLRSDAYGRFQAVAPFLAMLEERGAIFDLLPPSANELDDIVTRPVAACTPPLAYETDSNGRSLAGLLIADAKGGDALPLLQMTLQRLFDAEAGRNDGVLRLADYPGMDVAVTKAAEEAVAGLDAHARLALPQLLTAFVRDVVIDPSGKLDALTIKPVVRAEFERGDPGRKALIDEFVSRRLLTIEETNHAVQVRPVHEALIRVWPQAVEIIREDAALIRVRRTLESMVSDWLRADLPVKRDHLATSAALIAGATQLVDRFGNDLAQDMRAFISESLAADKQRRNADETRQRRILMATAAGLVLALALAGFAGWQWREAGTQKSIADSQRVRAESALLAATQAANTLVFDLAKHFRDRIGMPVDLVREILDRAKTLQEQLMQSGETAAALRFSAAQALNQLVLTLLEQGDARVRTHIAATLGIAERYRAIMLELVREDSANPEWQHELSLSLNRIGDVLVIMARHEDALSAYSDARVIRERLVSVHSDVRWRDALAASFSKIGDALRNLGRQVEALEAYEHSIAIRQKLVDEGGDDLQRHRELALGFERLGAVLEHFKRFEDALAAFTRSLDIRQRLTASQYDTQWERDLSISYEAIGRVLRELGRIDQSILAFRASLTIRERLVADDLGNRQRQRDLAVIYGWIGQALMPSSRDEALDYLHRNLAIRDRLAKDDPSNLLWQADLVRALRLLALAGDDPQARLTRALEIALHLEAQGKLSPEQEGWIDALKQELAALSK